MLRDTPDRVIYLILFAAVFAALSWMIPTGYHAAQPAEHYFEIQESSVAVDENDSSAHAIEMTYWARQRLAVDARLSLYAVQEDSTRSEIQAWRISEYIEPGAHTSTIEREVSEPLEDGTYVYRFRIRFETEYNVEKEYAHDTGQFTIVTADQNGTKEDSQAESRDPRIQPSITP